MSYSAELSDCLNSKIKDARFSLENPYAFLNDHGFYDAECESYQNLNAKLTPILPRKKSVYSAIEIEKIVKKIHKVIWEDYQKSENFIAKVNPIELLDPKRIIEGIGYSVDEPESLGEFPIGNKLVSVAGYIDNEEKRIYSSKGEPINRQLFTLAHELGHLVLHDGLRFHRERPIDGDLTRTGTEWEADKFATYFLMPSKLVKSHFQQYFGTSQLTVTPETLLLPANKPNRNANQRDRNRKDIYRLIAATEYFEGKAFVSLAKQFNVSIGAMGIRLEELKLIDFAGL